MSLIKHIRHFPARNTPAERAFLLCGFGGNIWQIRPLVHTLKKAGYDVTALDFSKTVLDAGDTRLLPELIDEVVEFAEKEARESSAPVLLVGVSLGALISLNLLRRSKRFDTAVMITGGDIVKVAKRLYGDSIWPQSYDELAKAWQKINMYSEPSELTGKRLLFVLPRRDRLIDVEDVRGEVEKQQRAGNALTLIERRAFGHVGTIVEEAVQFPRRTLRYIEHVETMPVANRRLA